MIMLRSSVAVVILLASMFCYADDIGGEKQVRAISSIPLSDLEEARYEYPNVYATLEYYLLQLKKPTFDLSKNTLINKDTLTPWVKMFKAFQVLSKCRTTLSTETLDQKMATVPFPGVDSQAVDALLLQANAFLTKERISSSKMEKLTELYNSNDPEGFMKVFLQQ